MGTHAADDAHKLVVAPELAEVAERLGVALHVGDRVRFRCGSRSSSGPRHHRPYRRAA